MTPVEKHYFLAWSEPRGVDDREDALILARFICTTMTSINVHEYPENANPRDLLVYRTAVQQAYLEGKPIEVRPRNHRGPIWPLWSAIDAPSFNWETNEYRVACPKLAGGRNTAGVTEEQVGVKDGWRLLTQAEHGPENRYLADVQYLKSDKTWSTTGTWCTGHEDLRTQKPAGFFLPKASPVAAGHNPDGLTADQVDVRSGWRLLSREEIEHRQQQYYRDLNAGEKWMNPTKNIQRWDPRTQSWDDRPYYGADLLSTFRTKFAPGHFLPKNLTIEGWLRTLPAGYRERAQANMAPEVALERRENLPVAILGAFFWSKAPEGFAFWAEVRRHFDDQSKHELPPLPNALPGVSGNYATTCDCSKLDLKGDIDLRVHVKLPECKPTAKQAFERLVDSIKKQPASARPKVYTPWTLETIPLPCVLRPRDPEKGKNRYCIALATPDGVYMGIRDTADGLGDEHFLAPYDFLFKHFEVSLDHGKTWSIAGREGV